MGGTLGHGTLLSPQVCLPGVWPPFAEEIQFSWRKQIIWERDAKGFFSHEEKCVRLNLDIMEVEIWPLHSLDYQEKSIPKQRSKMGLC